MLTFRPARVIAAVAMLWALAPRLAAQAQQSADSLPVIGLAPGAPHLRFNPPAASAPATPQLTAPDSLPCPQCNPKKHFWVAAAELLAVQVIPNLVSRAGGQEWAKVDFQSWGRNLTLPWQWDNNAFKNNQFSHPYHGAMYFNSARTNGYNFWESAPWAFVGSLTWELFGEEWAPAPNDLLNTTLGGIAVGEMMYRVSSLALSNEATGFDRVVREVAAGLLNPVRGFNRVVRGEAWKVSRTPPQWRESTIFGALDVGYRRFSTSDDLSDSTSLDGGILIAELRYGDLILDLDKKPFSAFRLQLTLATNNGAAGALSELAIRGNLGAKNLGSGQLSKLAGFMTYDYTANPILEFGGQGFYFGPVVGRRPEGGPRMRAEFLGQFMPVAAIASDYYLTVEGRDYDYGIGLGARTEAFVLWDGLARLGIFSRYLFIPIISGFPGDHQLFWVGATGRIYYKGRIGLGTDFGKLWRWSNYYGRNQVDQQNTELRIYLTTSIPQWREH